MYGKRRTKLFLNLHPKPKTVSELKVALENVQLHVTASSDRLLIASSPNTMNYRETSVLPGEQHRDCFLASTSPSTATLSVQS